MSIMVTSPYMQHKTIESVLERGEKLDNLVERSNALSAQSKMFYKTAKKVCQHFLTLTSAKFVLCRHVMLVIVIVCLDERSNTTVEAIIFTSMHSNIMSISRHIRCP